MTAPFRHPDLRVLWISTLSNQLGQGIQQVLLGWLVFDLTASPEMVGAIFAARSAPNLVVGLVAGFITDRLDRRTVMRFSVWGMMLGTLAVSLLLFSGQLNLWQLMAFTFLLGTFQAFYLTARQVYVYDVVGASGALGGLAAISLAQRIGQVIGALMAGGLIQWQGPAATFLVMSASYLFGVSTLYVLRLVGDSAPMDRESIAENILNYFRSLKSNRVMLSLMVSTAAAETLGFSHQALLPVLASVVLGVGPVGLGVLTAFRFVGGAVGVTALAMVGQVQRQGVLLLVVLGLFGLGQVMLGQSLTFWMALVFVALVNMMASITDVLHQTLLQRSVSNEQRGRAMGSWVVGTGTAPAGQLQIGYLAELSN
ncbi:MAG: MFS transporter, partial [Chloroflexi bacterium]|nr:MFS transporter [Chloroflexota bacterium]